MHEAFPRVRSFLKQFGYLAEVGGADIQRLDEASAIIHEALTKFQLLYGENIIGHPDGVLGPRTAHATTLQRCGCPDFFDPEIDSTRARSDRAGTGSWPAACAQALRVAIDTRGAPSWMDVDAIFEHSRQEFAKVGVRLVRVDFGQPAHIRQSFERLSGNTIGLAEFNNRSCQDSVFNKRHPGYNGGELRNLLLDLHELAHNMNVEHTQGGIMGPVIGDTKAAFVEFDAQGNIVYRDIAYPVLRGFFGEPLPAPPTPEPPAPVPIPVPPTPPTPSPRDPRMPPIDVTLIMQVIQAVLALVCPDATPQQARLAWRDNRPIRRLRVQMLFERELRVRLNVTPAQWRQEVRAQVMPGIYEETEAMSDEELESHLETAIVK